MASSRKSPEELAALAGNVQMVPQGYTEPKVGRSKRGIDKDLTSQICFRIEKDRHKALRVHCASVDKEIGEFMDDLLKANGW